MLFISYDGVLGPHEGEKKETEGKKMSCQVKNKLRE